jgi:ABC-type polysaccharide/polyol phosphate export systems, permease component
MFTSIWRHKQLIATLTRREVLGRYRGSVLGVLWSFVLPVFMLAVYTFVFSVVFRARWNEQSESRTEFALILFAGLLVFNLFSECVNRAPHLILQNQNYVKKVVFPLEILPLISFGVALFHTLVSYLVWQLFFCIMFGWPNATVALFPLVLLPLGLLTLGLSWALAALSVYLRDIVQLVTVLTTVLLFMSPIFYPVSALPKVYQNAMHLNPLAAPIDYARDVLMFGQVPSVDGWALLTGVSLVAAWIGFACFQKLRDGFADVL